MAKRGNKAAKTRDGTSLGKGLPSVRGFYEFSMMLNVAEAEAVAWEKGDRWPVLRGLQVELTKMLATEEEHCADIKLEFFADMKLEFFADDDEFHLGSDTPLDWL